MQNVPIHELARSTAGNWHLKQLLGNGKLSAVYAAERPGRSMAMFTAFNVPDTFSAQERGIFLQRFLKEGTKLVQLQQEPHILPVLEFGEHAGYPYLLTPFVNKESLASLLKKRGPFSVEDAQKVVQQVAASLDYTHKHDCIHGTLSLTNILVNEQLNVQVAGFGLLRLLEMRGIAQSVHPYGHMLSVVETFLGASEYFSPEYVQGDAIDGRADVYSLGVILFELLSGTCPFRGSNAYEVAMQHLTQPVPSLHDYAPSLPAGIDVVLSKALESDPALRYQTGESLATAFQRTLKMLKHSGTRAPALRGASLTQWPDPAKDTQTTMPPTVNWFQDDLLRGNSAKVPVAATSQATAHPDNFYDDHTSAMTLPAEDEVAAYDPFVWWSATSVQDTPGSMNGNGKTRPLVRPAAPRQRQKKVSQQGRRRTVVLLATGGAVAAGVLSFGTYSLAKMLHKNDANLNTANAQVNTTPAGSKQASPTAGQPSPTKTHKTTPTPHAKPSPTSTTQSTSTPTPAPTQNQPTPTQPPQPTPTPAPQHTGTVVGSTSMGTNSAQNFTNPRDGRGSLLIHLPDGRFVAFENACTHEGVACTYNSSTHLIFCPRHGANFDPANGARVVNGPPPSPLPPVNITVNADGTITVG